MGWDKITIRGLPYNDLSEVLSIDLHLLVMLPHGAVENTLRTHISANMDNHIRTTNKIDYIGMCTPYPKIPIPSKM